MKRMNFFVKLSAFFILIIVSMTSCLKEDENPYADYTAEREADLIKNWRNQMKRDTVEVDSFLIDSTTIYYIRDTTKVGTGQNVKAGDKLTVRYVGKYITGGTFDYSENFSYIHKVNRMVDGWEAGIELLKKGESAIFLIPSAKAYGPGGAYNGYIPPYSPLFFIIEVLDIK